jgi:hypothetical protein
VAAAAYRQLVAGAVAARRQLAAAEEQRTRLAASEAPATLNQRFPSENAMSVPAAAEQVDDTPAETVLSVGPSALQHHRGSLQKMVSQTCSTLSHLHAPGGPSSNAGGAPTITDCIFFQRPRGEIRHIDTGPFLLILTSNKVRARYETCFCRLGILFNCCQALQSLTNRKLDILLLLPGLTCPLMICCLTHALLTE